jgi:hypothetical protein
MFKGMKQSEKQSWENVRKQGHGRFILQKGLLREGLIFGAVLTLGPLLYDLLTHGGIITSLWNTIGGFILITLVVGYGVAETRWRKCEADYKEPTEPDSD